MSLATAVRRNCDICQAEHPKENPLGKLNVCAGCRAVYYCSVECQKSGWAAHKGLCQKTKKVGLELRNESGAPISQTSIRIVSKELSTPHTEQRALEKLDKVAFKSSGSKEKKAKRIGGDSSSSHRADGVKGREKDLTSFALKDQLRKVLPHLQREKNLDLSIQWIKGQLELRVHPILCLELSRIIRQKIWRGPWSAACLPLLIEAMVYKSLGFLLIHTDVACIDDPSAVAAHEIMHMTYELSKEENGKIKKLQTKKPWLKEKMQKVLKEKLEQLYKEEGLLASPLWVAQHCMSRFRGRDPAKSQAEWGKIRSALLEKFLKEGFALEGKQKKEHKKEETQ